MSEDKESEICKIAVQIVEQLGFTGLLRIDFIVDECSEKSMFGVKHGNCNRI